MAFDPTPGTIRPTPGAREVERGVEPARAGIGVRALEKGGRLAGQLVAGGVETAGLALKGVSALREAGQRQAIDIQRGGFEGLEGLSPDDQAEVSQTLDEIDEAERGVRPADETFLFRLGERIQRLAARVGPKEQQGFVEKLARAAGSTIPFLAVGILTRGALLPIAGAGASVGAGSLSAQARTAGADQATIDKAAQLGALFGSSEALPIGQLLNRIRAVVPSGSLGALARRSLVQALEEAAQEAGQGVAEDFAARALFDPERSIGATAGEEALTGGIIGAAMEILISVLTPGRVRGVSGDTRGIPPQEAAEEAAAPSEAASAVSGIPPEAAPIRSATGELLPGPTRELDFSDVAEIAPAEPVAAIPEQEVLRPAEAAEPSEIAPTAPEPVETAPVQQAEQIDLSDVGTSEISQIAVAARAAASETGERLFIATDPAGGQVIVAPSTKPGVAFQANFVDAAGNPAGDLQSQDFTTLLTVLGAKFGVDISSRRIAGAAEGAIRAVTETEARGVQEGEAPIGIEEHRRIEAQRAAERPGGRRGPPVRRTREEAQEAAEQPQLRPPDQPLEVQPEAAVVSPREQEIQAPAPTPRRAEGRPPVRARARPGEARPVGDRPAFPVRGRGAVPLAGIPPVGVPGVRGGREAGPGGPPRGVEPSRRVRAVPGERAVGGRVQRADQPDVGVPAGRAVAPARGPEAPARARGVLEEARLSREIEQLLDPGAENFDQQLEAQGDDLEVNFSGIPFIPWRKTGKETKEASILYRKAATVFSSWGEAGQEVVERLRRAYSMHVGEFAESLENLGTAVKAGRKIDGIGRSQRATNRWMTEVRGAIEEGGVDQLKPGQRAVVEAIQTEFDRIGNAFNAAGGFVLDPRFLRGPRKLRVGFELFFPRVPKREILNDLMANKQERMEELVQFNIERGMDETTARLRANEFFHERFSGFFAGMEKPRLLEIPPAWRDDNILRSLHTYFSRGWIRAAEINEFGQDGVKSLALKQVMRLAPDKKPGRGEWKALQEFLRSIPPENRTKLMNDLIEFRAPPGLKTGLWGAVREQVRLELESPETQANHFQMLLEQIKNREGGSKTDVATVMRVYEDVFGRTTMGDFARKWNYYEGNLTFISKVATNGMNQFLQATQIRTVPAQLGGGIAGFRRTIDAARILMTDPEARRFVRTSGAVIKDYQKLFADQTELDGLLGKTSRAASVITGIKLADRMPRQVAAMGSMLYANDWLELRQAGKSGRVVNRMERMLKKWEIDPDVVAERGHFTDAEKKLLMQRAVSLSQGGFDALDDVVWAKTVGGRTVLRLKKFAIREAQFGGMLIGEAAKGNVAPLLTYLATTWASGELYVWLKNAILGRDEERPNVVEAIQNEEYFEGLVRVVDRIQAAGAFGLWFDAIEPSQLVSAAGEAEEGEEVSETLDTLQYFAERTINPPVVGSLVAGWEALEGLATIHEAGAEISPTDPLAPEKTAEARAEAARKVFHDFLQEEWVLYSRVTEAVERRDPAFIDRRQLRQHATERRQIERRVLRGTQTLEDPARLAQIKQFDSSRTALRASANRAEDQGLDGLQRSKQREIAEQLEAIRSGAP